MKILKKLFSSLNRDKVKYMVAGGVAVNLYGIERATADVDIVLMLDNRNLSQFVKTAKKLALKPKMPVNIESLIDQDKRKEWAKDKDMKVFGLYDEKSPFFLVDIFIEMPFNFDEVYRKRKRVKLENITIPVVPIKELVNMKKKSDRPQDKADIFYLKKIMRGWKDEK